MAASILSILFEDQTQHGVCQEPRFVAQ